MADAPTLAVSWGTATDPGGRLLNEDAHLAAPPVFLVADGMGGHRGGDLAAAAVVRAFEGYAGQSWLQPEELHAAVATAAHDIAAIDPGPQAPGSTLAGVALAASGGVPCWLVFNVGDSRTYRIQGEQLEQVSVDHSLVETLRAAGQLDGSRRVGRNLITRAIGAGQAYAPAIDQWLLPALPGDRLLICSDGLTGEVTDEVIAAVLAGEPDSQAAAETLVRTAIAGGARDNVTAVVVTALGVGVRGGVRGGSAGASDRTVPVDRTVPGEVTRA